MGGLVEDQIRRVMTALLERDGELAQEVIDRDRQVNAYDVEVDEKCVELLALHQPAAGDLRFITTAMKIVTDLERIGDQAVNIAQRALELNQEPQLKPYIDLPRMAEPSQRMVKESLDAFVARDTELARRVCAEDAEVDALKEQIFRELLTFMMGDARTIPRAIRLILISRFLERVADHATNIAEMVIYMVDSSRCATPWPDRLSARPRGLRRSAGWDFGEGHRPGVTVYLESWLSPALSTPERSRQPRDRRAGRGRRRATRAARVRPAPADHRAQAARGRRPTRRSRSPTPRSRSCATPTRCSRRTGRCAR